MGCPCEVAIYADSRSSARSAFDCVENEVMRLDRKYSHYRPEGWLVLFQQDAMRPGGVRADAETAALLNYSEQQYRLSEGAFDITAAPVISLWDRIDQLPEPESIDAALARSGWHRCSWDGEVLRLAEGAQLNFGGIVKEYAADRAAALLKARDFSRGYVDLGGDFHFLGAHPDGSPWQVGIRNPADRGRAFATVPIRRGGLASSGDYERFSQVDGRRYGHIINAKTGWPVDTSGCDAIHAVSVTAPSCLVAGSIATLAMIQQGERAKAFLRESGLNWVTDA